MLGSASNVSSQVGVLNEYFEFRGSQSMAHTKLPLIETTSSWWWLLWSGVLLHAVCKSWSWRENFEEGKKIMGSDCTKNSIISLISLTQGKWHTTLLLHYYTSNTEDSYGQQLFSHGSLRSIVTKLWAIGEKDMQKENVGDRARRTLIEWICYYYHCHPPHGQHHNIIISSIVTHLLAHNIHTSFLLAIQWNN